MEDMDPSPPSRIAGIGLNAVMAKFQETD